MSGFRLDLVCPICAAYRASSRPECVAATRNVNSTDPHYLAMLAFERHRYLAGSNRTRDWLDEALERVLAEDPDPDPLFIHRNDLARPDARASFRTQRTNNPARRAPFTREG